MQIVHEMWKHKPSATYDAVQCPVLIVPARFPTANVEDIERLKRKERLVQRAQESIKDARVLWMDSVHDVPLHRPIELAHAISAFIHQ